MSTVKEWLDIFYNDYICLNLKSYSNIGVDLEIVKIILAVALAAVICGIMLDYHNKYTYAMIKQLLRHEAISEDKAKTLGELNLADMKPLRCALSSSGKLTGIVARCGEHRLTDEEFEERKAEYIAAKKKDKRASSAKFFGTEIDFESAKFYIREESRPYAMRVFNGADVSVLRTVLRSALILIVAVLVVIMMPSFVSWLNELLG